MAQREKEETELKGICPCANNCGFPGNPATNNLCQKCFAAAGIRPSIASNPSHELQRAAAVVSSPDGARSSSLPEPPQQLQEKQREEADRRPNRCFGCRKRVGLTGFRCRCGELFCGEHRYSDRHVCTFDYRAAGREEISRANPVVKAAKIVRI